MEKTFKSLVSKLLDKRTDYWISNSNHFLEIVFCAQNGQLAETVAVLRINWNGYRAVKTKKVPIGDWMYPFLEAYSRMEKVVSLLDDFYEGCLDFS